MNKTTAGSLPVEALLKPRSLAFVGVSARGGAGTKMLQSAQAFGFTGPLWPVNANAPQIAGIACHKTLAALPAAPDCVVISVPAEAVLGVLKDAAAKGAKAALVVSEGFADEASDAGRARQAELIAFARGNGIAVAGPNCMGIASMAYHSAATMADIPDGIAAGGVSLVSQSGGLLNAVAELASNRGLGLNFLISNGNGAVVEIADYIDFLADDAATRVITVIMEGASDGRRFRAAIEKAAAKKPIVVLKLGRSVFGQAATLAHTGTLAGKHEAFEALFRQNGVALVDSIDQLVETAALLDAAPLPKGDGVCMFTVSGGATSLIADLGEAAGVNFPPISAKTNTKLKAILAVERNFGNPVDTVGMPRLRKDGNIKPVVEALIADDGIDVIGLVLGMRMAGADSHEELVAAMAALVEQAKVHQKPLMVCSFMHNSLTGLWRGHAGRTGLPIVEDLDRGLKAVRHLVDYATFRRRLATGARHAAKPLKLASMKGIGPGQTLTEADSKLILAEAGLPVTKEFLAKTPAEAVALAAKVGGPVALKVQSPDIPHKSDIGGVHLGAKSADEVRDAAAKVLDNARRNCPKADIHGVLVQEMVANGVEFILGMTYDEQFGPLVVLGAGGVTVEVFKDAAVRLAPLSRDDAREMVASLKAARMLAPFRGAGERDTEALIDACVAFGSFVAATDGQFAAIDLNPVFVCDKGRGVRIADALIVTRTA